MKNGSLPIFLDNDREELYEILVLNLEVMPSQTEAPFSLEVEFIKFQGLKQCPSIPTWRSRMKA